MNNNLKLQEVMVPLIRCPVSKSNLYIKNDFLISSSDNSIRYPIIDHTPVLINNDNSLFNTAEYNNNKCVDPKSDEGDNYKRLVSKFIPSISNNLVATKNFKLIAELIPKNSKILILGGGSKGQGMECIYDNKSFTIVNSDVYFNDSLHLISDAHDIPFIDDTFDLVVIQAVLEHVIDPVRCVEEIYRVLKKDSLVYAEVPFMQQVHMREYDFTRFTYLGLRRLFRNFHDIGSGVCCGPGMSLAWSYSYFLGCFSENKIVRKVITYFSYLTSFFLKYLDYYLLKKPDAYSCSSGFYFIGRKTDEILSDTELLKQYRGL